jgi:hypothetical protein
MSEKFSSVEQDLMLKMRELKQAHGYGKNMLRERAGFGVNQNNFGSGNSQQIFFTENVLIDGSGFGYGENEGFTQDGSVRSNRAGTARGFDVGDRPGSPRSRVDSRGGSRGVGYVNSSLNRFSIAGLGEAKNGCER